jgi:hypothetical protein
MMMMTFYTDKTWGDRNLTFQKCWKNDEDMGIQINVNLENILIMLHKWGITRFFPNTQLIYKTGSATGDCNELMSVTNLGSPFSIA